MFCCMLTDELSFLQKQESSERYRFRVKHGMTRVKYSLFVRTLNKQ